MIIREYPIRTVTRSLQLPDQFSLREVFSSLNSLTFYSEKNSVYLYPLQKINVNVASTRRDALHGRRGGARRRNRGRGRAHGGAGADGGLAQGVEAIGLRGVRGAAAGGQHRH